MNHSAPLQSFKARRTATPFAPQYTGIDVHLGDYDEGHTGVHYYSEGKENKAAHQCNKCISTKNGFLYSKTLIN